MNNGKKTIKILLVDDEFEFVETLGKRLASRGFEADCVTSGSAAMDHIIQKPYDVVITDLMMPQMNGLQLFSEIKKLAPTVSVIILTGLAEIDLAIDGIKSGLFDYIVKPVNFDELIEKISMAYDKQKLNKATD